jgi:hypothetical protein
VKKWRAYQPTAYDLQRDPSLAVKKKAKVKGFNWARWNAENSRAAREADIALAVLKDMKKEQQ